MTLFSTSLPDFISEHAQQWFKEHIGAIKHIHELPNGHHQIWYCQTDRGEFIVRQPHSEPFFGTDYQRENFILQEVYQYPWAIHGQIYTPEEPWLSYPYIQGRSLTTNDLSQSPTLFTQLHDILRHLSRIPQPSSNAYYRQMQPYLHHYLSLAHYAPRPLLEIAHQWLADFPTPADYQLNHHDLSLANLILTPEQQLVVLDWEYAAFSDPGWDIATLLENFQFSTAQRHCLLEQAQISLERINVYQCASQLLDLCWYSQQPLMPAQLEQWHHWLKRVE